MMAIAGFTPHASAMPQQAGAFLLSSQGCGRATGYSEANKIITHDGKTHVSWLDSIEGKGFQVRVRTLDHASGEWSEPVTIDEAFDNHGGAALALDSDGFLHICYYPHHHPMRYRRSLRPNDSSEWTEAETFGKRTTYPTLVCGPDNTLYCTCRESGDGPWVANLYTKKPGEGWAGPRAILQSQHTGYSHFMDALAWGPDHQTLHLCTRIYSGDPARGHTIGYLRSRDGGVTWEDSAGKAVELPATAETIDVVVSSQSGEGPGLRAGSIAVDRAGIPIILCSDYDTSPPQAWISRPSGTGSWTRQSLTPELPEELKGCGLITPGTISIGESGRIYITLTAVRAEEGESLWGHKNSAVVWFESDSFGGPFDVQALTSLDGTPRWLPNLERPTGHNTVQRPSLIYTQGGPGEKNTQVISNDVQWMRP
jgi:hypothetical protein